VLQDEMAKLAELEGTSSSSGNAKAKLNNVLMQMRKNCNHPDLITSAFTADLDYPPPEVRRSSSNSSSSSTPAAGDKDGGWVHVRQMLVYDVPLHMPGLRSAE
jgi:SNF2 family DNA or RNA helicase